VTVLNQEIPPPVALEGILRKITETLAKELAHPAPMHAVRAALAQSQ
jgi:hypothetical protein